MHGCVYSTGEMYPFWEWLFSTAEIGFGVTQVSLFTKQVYLQFEFDFNPCGAACVIFTTPEQFLGKRFTELGIYDGNTVFRESSNT